MMNKKILSVLILLLVISFSTTAFASLTFTTDAITGTSASTIDLGTGNTLFLNSTNNAPITTGTGLVTLGGDLSVTNDVSIAGITTFTFDNSSGFGWGSSVPIIFQTLTNESRPERHEMKIVNGVVGNLLFYTRWYDVYDAPNEFTNIGSIGEDGDLSFNSYTATETVTAGTGFISGASVGLSGDVVVTDSDGVTNCSMTFTGGILTDTSCDFTLSVPK